MTEINRLLLVSANRLQGATSTAPAGPGSCRDGCGRRQGGAFAGWLQRRVANNWGGSGLVVSQCFTGHLASPGCGVEIMVKPS